MSLPWILGLKFQQSAMVEFGDVQLGDWMVNFMGDDVTRDAMGDDVTRDAIAV